jgi:chaperonin GroES
LGASATGDRRLPLVPDHRPRLPQPTPGARAAPGKRGGSMNVRPLRDRILLERIEEQEQRFGGIIIPDSAKEKPQQGRVVAVGKGRINDKGDVFPLDVKAGDTVLFGKYSGSEIKVNGKEYLILREEEVLGVIEGVTEPALA